MKTLKKLKFGLGSLMILVGLVGLSGCAKDNNNNSGGGSSNNTSTYGSCQVVNGQYILNGQAVPQQYCNQGSQCQVHNGQYYLNGQIVSPQACQNNLGGQQCQVINGQYYLNGQLTTYQYCQQLQYQNPYQNQWGNQGYMPGSYNQRCTYRNYYGFWYQYCY